ncbi:serine--tRNA ligase [Candidatus Berkelbacteria bacterium]|nr:serine--tRNA ligase [Candidatus Berkelbacteria bacterium]
MLDISFLRENENTVARLLAKRDANVDLKNLFELDGAKRQALVEVEKLRHDLNEASKKQDKAAGKLIKETLKKAEQVLHEASEALYAVMVQMNNIPHESVPSSEDGTKTIDTWGELPKFDFKPKDHLELGQALDVIDIERAVKISGARFAMLKNELVDLEFALVGWVFDKLAKKGFTKILPPMLVREQAMFGTGFFPAEKSEIYKTDQDDLYLIGTAEVPLASYHAGEKIDVAKKPMKYAGFSSSFRREAGAYGKDTRGIIRLHQFDKVEMFVYADPQNSWEEFENLAAISKEIFEELRLPYRQVVINAGELGAPNAKKYDFEIWIPSQHEYRELASCSHDTDFQARRLNIKTTDGRFVHTLNDTALAIGRTIVAIVENYQKENGDIEMPSVLHPYLSFKTITKKA